MEKNLTAFLIDDDQDDQEFFALVMDENFPNVQYLFASDGIEALKKLNNEPEFTPHIILIDINMPRMNGIDCLTEIKKINRLNCSHIYMYSTSSEPRIVYQCQELGANGFIKKVATTEALQDRFSKAISLLKIPSL